MEDLDILRISYPRVSDIISKQNEAELKAIPLEILVKASTRGTKIHEYCTTYMRNLWVMDIEPEYLPYFDAFRQWFREEVDHVVHTSVRLYDDVKRFTGEFDMIVKLKNSSAFSLIDIKTSSSPSKAWPIQLAAYVDLCRTNGYQVDRHFNLHLKRKKEAVWEETEGKKVMISPPQIAACLIEYKDISAPLDIFTSALKCYDYFSRKEPKNVRL